MRTKSTRLSPRGRGGRTNLHESRRAVASNASCFRVGTLQNKKLLAFRAAVDHSSIRDVLRSRVLGCTMSLQRVCGGASMAPTVQPGERVELFVGASRRARAGDAVVFCGANGDYDILHRFVFKVPFLPYFVHRGDAPSARAGVARCDRMIGTACLANRPPLPREYCEGMLALASHVWRVTTRRLRGKSAYSSLAKEQHAAVPDR